MEQTHDRSRQARRAALTVATLTSFLGPFLASSVNVALPSIGEELGLGAVELAWVNTAFLLTASSFLIPFGRLGDLYGRRRIYCAGVFVLGAASAFLAAAGSGAVILGWRAVQGLGAAMVMATALPILVAVYPARERGAAIGLNVAAVYAGLSSGPYLGGLLTELLSWRAVFWLFPPLAVFLLVVALRLLPADEGGPGEGFDWTGSLLLVVSLLVLMYGLSDLPGFGAATAAAIGVMGLAVFAKLESKVEHPIVDLDLFRHNRVFAFSSLAALIHYAATFAVSFLMSLYLQKVRGLSPQAAGLILVAQPLTQAVLSPAAGRLSDRMQPRLVASSGMTITLLGLVLLAFVDASTRFGSILALLALLGVGFAFFSSPNTSAIMGSVGPRQYGLAAAMVASARQLGMMLSMALVMLVLTLDLGEAPVGSQTAAVFLASMKMAFMLFAALCAAGILASLVRGELPREPQSSEPPDLT
jgi:EmrB/QacA subfamily drug resistance transporter